MESIDKLLCPSCVKPVHENAHFCPHCGVPLTSFATTDPLQSIRSEGEMVRRAAKNPSTLALVGIWVLFAPACLVFYFAASALIMDQQSGPVEKVLGVALCTFFAILFSAIFWNVTARYVTWMKSRGSQKSQ